MENNEDLNGIQNRGVVIVADPNVILAQDKNLVNGVLPVEDLRPYVSFKCFRRKEHLIEVNANGNVSTASGDVAEEVHFLGFNEKTKQFSVSYADNVTGVNDSEVFPESFGITDISVTHDANMMPLVDVTFVDIKGASLLSRGDKSPYAAIFDYPPPIFKLTMKGAFGMYVEYDLHMTKNDITYDSNSGNYIIKAKFIGEYFGPLTDILTGWLRAVPFLGEKWGGVGADTVYKTDEDTTVDSYFELIHRGSMLYTKIADYKQNSSDMSEYNKLISVDEEVNNILSFIEGFTDSKSMSEKMVGYGFGGIKTYKVESKQNIKDYKTTQYGGFKIVYSFPLAEGLQGNLLNNNGQEALKVNAIQVEAFKKFIKTELTDKLKKEFNVLNRESTKYSYTISVGNSIEPISNDVSLDDDRDRNVISVNLTSYINGLLKGKFALEGYKENSVSTITSNFKQMVRNTLGIDPRIGEIFRILLKDFDIFMKAIKEAGEAEKNLPNMDSSNGATVLSSAPWPSVVQDKVYKSRLGSGASSQSQKVFIYPATQKEFKDWGECKLVEDYCASLVQQKRAFRALDKIIKQIDTNLYNPITPLEAFTYSDTTHSTNEYIRKESKELFIKTMLMRFLFMREYAYKGIVTTTEDSVLDIDTWFSKEIPDKESRTKLIKSLAKIEAQNAANGLTNNEIRNEIKNWDYGKLVTYLNSASVRNVESLSKNDDTASIDRYMITGYNQKFDSGKGRDKGLPYVNFRGEPFYKRNHANFKGITEITNDSDAVYGRLTQPKGEYLSDEATIANEDKMVVLAEHSKNSSLLFWKSENKVEEPVLTNANTLLFVDSKSKEGEGQSDFFSDSSDIKTRLFNKLFPKTITGEIISDISGSLIGSERTWVGNQIQGLFNEISRKLVHDGFVKIPYSNVKSEPYNKDIFEKFIQPATIEMPFLAAACLGQFLIDNPYGEYLSPKDYDKLINTRNKFIDKYDSLINAIEESTFDGYIKPDGSLDINKEANALNSFKEMPELSELFKPVYLINNSVMTFIRKDHVKYGNSLGMNTLMNNGSVLGVSYGGETDESFKVYVNEFFTQLKGYIKSEDDAVEAEDKETEKQINDPDFKSNLYYNFKTIYDRWLAGNKKWDTEGSSFDKFAFITRSHQNIADISVVDFQNLIDDAKDGEVSVFTSIGKLLQENNFNFFPLNSYIDLTRQTNDESSEKAWRKSFEMYNGLTKESVSTTKFLCMYVGGYSAQVDAANTEYPQDSVKFDLDVDRPSDFENKGNGSQKVFSFKVRAGSQNQSIFTGFGLSTEEFKVTDESIRMHSDIIDAQSESNPIRKSQNLLNIYNQRSYTCSVTVPFGNMCIQPTQYFELDGIKLFGGAYMIFNVQHAISSESQRVETRFKGWRISKYVHPVIDDYVLSYLGLDSETSGNIAQNGNHEIAIVNRIDSNEGIEGMRSGVQPKVNHSSGSLHGLSPSSELKGDNDDSYIQTYLASNSKFKDNKLAFEEWIPEDERTEFTLKVKAICYELGGDTFNPDWLMMVMYKESKIKPQNVNPSTYASGLIQVIPSTAGDITDKYNKLYRTKFNKPKVGKLSVQMILGLGRVQQLNIVRTYLHRILDFRGLDKLNSYWIVNLGVFRPASAKHYNNEDKIMFKRGSIEYTKNDNFDPNGWGYVTIGMYKNAIKKSLVKGGIPKDIVLNLS